MQLPLSYGPESILISNDAKRAGNNNLSNGICHEQKMGVDHDGANLLA